MKSLRYVVLMMAVGAACIFPMRAYSQQEVDPDHFDQPAKVAAPKLQSTQRVASAHHHHHINRTVATRHRGSRGQAHSRAS